MKRFGRILRNIGVVLLVLILLLVIGGVWFVRRPLPQVSGQISMQGLTAPVQVVRDKMGIPSIYAQNDHDLFFAQGYVHAQDRLWQMEINRRAGSGTLSAALGKATIATDQLVRTMGWRRAAEKDWSLLDEDARAQLTAYTDGVNAYVNTHRDRLPIEFTILGVNYEPWTPLDTLAWGKAVTFSLAGNYRLELLRAQIISQLGEDVAQQLLPPYGNDKPIIIPPDAQGYASFKNDRFPGLDGADVFMGEPGPVSGSNNWVVSGNRTTTGKPILANDTHLAAGIPSIWYANGLHGGRFNVVGFTFPGVPGVIIGHNDRIAWGVSNVNPDVEDLYMEKLDDPKNPTQYEFKGQWQPLDVISDTIQVKGQAPMPLRILQTRHGPIINDAIAATPGVTAPLAFRWRALDGSTQFQAILQIDRAQNWDEFRNALKSWDSPSQNFVYADVDGNIGYQTPGSIPIRPVKDQGLVPVPGWTGEYEWGKDIPFDELPKVFNPSTGFLATANNKIVSDDYPYTIAYEWDPGFRAKRITDLIQAKPKLSLEDIQTMQADTYSLAAEALEPYLLQVQPKDDTQKAVLDQVRGWDKRYEIDRTGGAIYQVWYWFLLKNTLDDDLGNELADKYLAGAYERHGTFQVPLMIKIMADPKSPWFDDKTTPQVETRDDIESRSLADAINWLSQRYGSDPTKWTWGRLHTLTLAATPLGQTGIAPLTWLFSVGPMPVRGDNFSIDGASFRYSNPFVMVHGASQRDIIDLSDLNNSIMTLTTGVSGQTFSPHYKDFISTWQNVQYHPMYFDRGRLDADSEATLTLSPP